MGEPNQYPSCAVCGRTILRGERVADYVTPEGETEPVCALCKPRAEASDWTPATLAGVAGRGQAARRRRAINLRERLTRVSEAASARLGRREADAEADAPPSSPPPAPRAPAAPQPASPERAMRRAVDAFNASPEARTVRGLRRSLGEPRVAVHAVGDGGEVAVTVAWELSWYRWRVGGDGGVDEIGKGKEVSELAESDRNWNGAIEEDGRLRLAPARRPERIER